MSADPRDEAERVLRSMFYISDAGERVYVGESPSRIAIAQTWALIALVDTLRERAS